MGQTTQVLIMLLALAFCVWVFAIVSIAHDKGKPPEVGYSQTVTKEMPRYTTTIVTVGQNDCAVLLLDRGDVRAIPLFCGPSGY